MRTFAAAVPFVACVLASAQSYHDVDICSLTECHFTNTSVMEGMRFEDYKVTNPAAVQFDPAQRMLELAALSSSTTATMCAAPPSFTVPAPTITFDKNSVQAQIYFRPQSTDPNALSDVEFMDVQFSNLAASNGYTSPSFGFTMLRRFTGTGSAVPQYEIQYWGIPGGIGFVIDPVGKTATLFGTMASSVPLRQAIFGVFVNAQSILSAAKFTVTAPTPAGVSFWTAAEIPSLAGQAAPWILAAVDPIIPIGPPYTCATFASGYTTCNGQTQIDAFTNTILNQGAEYLGLRTQQSYNVLTGNLLSWARARAPSIDPDYAAKGGTIFLPPLSTSILMLWPTLRANPALSASDAQTIDNWISGLISPRPMGGWFSDDLGYWQQAVNMADSIRRSDHAGFAQGIATFYGALQQMRADGSFPLAAQLSACSSVYLNADLIHLTTIAEMAASQGYDLYHMSYNGRTFDTAINFMLDAYENPSLLAQYSKAGGGICFEGKPGDPPDFSSYKNPNGDLAWMEPYIARFPLSATAARLRKILGSNIGATPFPLMNLRTGLNTTCAFRKPYEFQAFNGARVTVVSGDHQTAAVNQLAAAPLTVRVTDNSGKPLAGALVSYAVTGGSATVTAPAQVLTDASGMASANVAIGPGSGPVTVTATAFGVRASLSLTVPGVGIYPGGVAGIGGSVPAVTTISPGALFSIYGQDFVAANAGRRVNPNELVNGVLPTNLLGVCVSVGEKSAPLLDVYSNQINAVAPAVTPATNAAVVVTTGCGTPNAVQSVPEFVQITQASPEFLYFVQNANGQNPVAAVNSLNGANVGPASLGPGFAPAHPGDVITVYGSGFGPTNPAVAPGAVASGVAPALLPVTVTLGSIVLDPSDVLYAGAAPGEPISQLNIRIPSGIRSGNQPVQIQVGGLVSPPGAFLAVAVP